MSIQVSIVEDDNDIRESLSLLLRGSPGLMYLGGYPSAEEALKDLPKSPPDVVLMDINLPEKSGIECVRELKEIVPKIQVIMLTVYEDTEKIFDALKAGASGYLLKRTPPAKLLEAIEDVHQGGSPMTRHIARKVVQYFQSQPKAASEISKLTDREQQILDQLAQGYLYKEIGTNLGISTETVRGHLRNIYEKLQVHSRTEAVVKYLRR